MSLIQQHLCQNESKTPHIDCRPIRRHAINYFWRLVAFSTKIVGFEHFCFGLHLSEPEIEEPCTRRCHEDVSRFDVAMDKAETVDVAESMSYGEGSA